MRSSNFVLKPEGELAQDLSNDLLRQIYYQGFGNLKSETEGTKDHYLG